MLGCNKNYTTLALHCALKNSKEHYLLQKLIYSIETIKKKIRTHKTLKRALVNMKE